MDNGLNAFRITGPQFNFRRNAVFSNECMHGRELYVHGRELVVATYVHGKKVK